MPLISVLKIDLETTIHHTSDPLDMRTSTSAGYGIIRHESISNGYIQIYLWIRMWDTSGGTRLTYDQ